MFTCITHTRLLSAARAAQQQTVIYQAHRWITTPTKPRDTLGGKRRFECCCKQSLPCDQSGERCELADERLRCLTGNEQEWFFHTTWPGVMFWNAMKCLLRSLGICLWPSWSVVCKEYEGFGLSEMSQVLLFLFSPPPLSLHCDSSLTFPPWLLSPTYQDFLCEYPVSQTASGGGDWDH